MVQYTNFYENVKEAQMRLDQTVVLYDGKPYYVLCVTDHKGDGIFRIYLDEMGQSDGAITSQKISIPFEWMDEGPKTRGVVMDEWLEKNPNKGVIRKQMNSPKFDRFRPFPLGMCNFKGSVVYLERAPTRHTQQGLTASMISANPASLNPNPSVPSRHTMPGIFSVPMFATIMGQYPNPYECLNNLKSPEVTNSGVAFHREFAFIRGPVDLMFLVYKQDVIGYMPDGDFTRVNIARPFRHTKEVVEGLNLFQTINV